MSEDLNNVIMVGRLTRDNELAYTNSGYAVCKFSLAVNRRKKDGDNWVDEVNFFDVVLWGKRGEALSPYLLKGQQIGIEGQLKQERWEQDGNKRSKVVIEADKIQLLGSKSENTGGNNNYQQQGNPQQSTPQGYQQQNPQQGYQQPVQQPVQQQYQPPGQYQQPVQPQQQQGQPTRQYQPPQGQPMQNGYNPPPPPQQGNTPEVFKDDIPF